MYIGMDRVGSSKLRQERGVSGGRGGGGGGDLTQTT